MSQVTAPPLELKTRMAAYIVLGVCIVILCALLFVIGGIGTKVAIVLCAVGYVWLGVVLARRRLFVDASGIHSRNAFSTTRITWDEVDHYTYWSMGQQAVYVGGAGLAGAIIVGIVLLIGKALRKGPQNRRFTMGQLVIVGNGGQKIKVDARFKDVVAALDICFAELHNRLRIRRRDYAPFSLTDTELVHAKKGPIGLPDIEKVDAAQSRLSVRKRGKRLAWVSLHMKHVKNVMLLVEDLAERGLVVNAQAEVFVPPPVLHKLLEAQSRQAALPRAEIRRH